ncbi:MAG: biosynthetic peptidoglycan transglycosylase, partial [Elusimicrobiota bacterium]
MARRSRKGPIPRSLLWLAPVLLLAACAVYLSSLPEVGYLRRENPRTTAFIELHKDRMRAKGLKPSARMTWAPISSMSPDLVHAVIISEDDMFYLHKGVDWEALREAMKYNIEKRRPARGASTITQQLARNLFLSPSKNPLRKIKEYLIA